MKCRVLLIASFVLALVAVLLYQRALRAGGYECCCDSCAACPSCCCGYFTENEVTYWVCAKPPSNLYDYCTSTWYSGSCFET